jgi:mRNA interferase RelE/StbE
MTYRLEFLAAARRDLKRLPKPIQVRIAEAVRDLAENPRPPGVKKMAGEPNAWRLRVGDYRVVYEIHDGRLLILVIRLGHRKDIYRQGG